MELEDFIGKLYENRGVLLILTSAKHIDANAINLQLLLSGKNSVEVLDLSCSSETECEDLIGVYMSLDQYGCAVENNGSIVEFLLETDKDKLIILNEFHLLSKHVANSVISVLSNYKCKEKVVVVLKVNDIQSI